MQDTHISLAHGNGGRYMRELIEEIFARHLANPDLDVHADAVPITLEDGEVLFTTDGFTVQPLEFPGGNIGSLAVHGTTNDLAVAGAIPKYLSLNAFIEEGMEIATLERIIETLAVTAAEIGVKVVAGDTKVLRRGEGGGLYLATTGVGVRNGNVMSMKNIRHGDVLIVSGPVGDHGIAVMLAREEFGLRGDIQSDAASVLNLTTAAMKYDGLRFMRDPTRGGIATVCSELQRATGMGVRLQQADLPVRDPVQSVCDMLGYDPMYLACEGRVVAVVDAAQAQALLQTWQGLEEGAGAAIIGNIDSDIAHVLMTTDIGGERILEELEDDPLPRIC
ncbi:MAG: hydrogenase expression/formation protein HypE [Gammaproteobacteria bacterium]|nr:hydrogenase expression/formation protein HypE [Gammaproteobacteria bacterium]MBT8133164.1 hydrogenase expression/formation protein HypE [Gammaproteobacteria bacterium]NNJ49877.1 hydrogenase expression/formation protein HypE [Gammaproteobacteria bacterium]